MKLFKKVVTALVLIGLAMLPAGADTIRAVPKGCHTITSFSGSSALPTIDAGATFMVYSVEGNTVRYRDDGTAPTATVGILLQLGVSYYSGTLSAIQFIPTTGSAVVNYCDYQ